MNDPEGSESRLSVKNCIFRGSKIEMTASQKGMHAKFDQCEVKSLDDKEMFLKVHPDPEEA